MKVLGIELEQQAWDVRQLIPPWAARGSVGVEVSRSTSLGVATVWACVRLLTSTVSRMPVDVLIDGEDGIPRSYPAPRWLRRPIVGNPNFDRVAHFAQVMVSLLMEGNFFTLTPRDDSNDVSEVFVLDPQKVEITGTLTSPGYKVRNGSQSAEYGPDEILHRGLLTLPGTQRGVSPLDAAYHVFGVGLASQEYAGRFFSQSQTPPGYIKVPQGSKVSIAELKDGWEENHAGAENWHRPGVLTGGAEWAAIAITNEQAQFLEQRQFSVSEIARWFGVPPYMVGDVERSTSWGTGIEQQGIGFNTYSLNDYLVLLEEAYRALIPNPRSFLRFNRNALMRGDAKSRVDFYRGMWELGAMNSDDIRAKEDMPPLAGGTGRTYYYQSSNFSPVGTVPQAAPTEEE